MKVSDNFNIKEFVDKTTYLRYGDKSVTFINPKIFVIMERIRILCGARPITINNWEFGGKFQYRGFRPSDCPVGAIKSRHKRGEAVDFDVKGMSAEQVRGVIRLNQVELMKLGLRRMESGVGWVHIDLMETGLDYIYEFRP